MVIYEMDHWVLFDTLNNDQIDRLKTVISSRVKPESSARPAPGASFQSLLDAETMKLEKKS